MSNAPKQSLAASQQMASDGGGSSPRMAKSRPYSMPVESGETSLGAQPVAMAMAH